jgi:hypothetical protein
MTQEFVVHHMDNIIEDLQEKININANYFINPYIGDKAGPCALIYMLGAIPETHEETVLWLDKNCRKHFLFFQETGLGVITVWPRH